MLATYISNEAAVLKSVAFGIARGLTQTAKAASQEVTSDLPSIFDRPTPFTSRAIGFSPAKRDTLEAQVFVRDVQAGYLMMQETGGIRTPKPGSPINLAVGQRTNIYGNIARGAIAREKLKPNIFTASGRDPRTKHLSPGLYRRAKVGKRDSGSRGTKGRIYGKNGKAGGSSAVKGGTTLKLLVAFKRKATYKPRFGFEDRVTAAAKASLGANVVRSVADALATMR